MGWFGGGLLAYTALQGMGIDLIGIVVMGGMGLVLVLWFHSNCFYSCCGGLEVVV